VIQEAMDAVDIKNYANVSPDALKKNLLDEEAAARHEHRRG